jgi:hypothetical protein
LNPCVNEVATIGEAIARWKREFGMINKFLHPTPIAHSNSMECSYESYISNGRDHAFLIYVPMAEAQTAEAQSRLSALKQQTILLIFFLALQAELVYSW